MENIKNIFEDLMKTKIIASVIIIILSIIIYKLISYLINRQEKNNKHKLFKDKKSKTYLKLLKNILRYCFVGFTILLVLQVNGIDVSSVLAGVGIAGVVLGLAIQDWLKDIIRGSTILSDNYFSVGDVVKYKDTEGKVLELGLKTTKIQDLKTGYIRSIANRNIEEIDLVSNLIYINIPIPYEVSVEKAEKAINDIVSTIRESKNVTNCRYIGVNELADSSINYCIEVSCEQTQKLQTRRDALRTILLELENNNIQVPYTQIDIHNK